MRVIRRKAPYLEARAPQRFTEIVAALGHAVSLSLPSPLRAWRSSVVSSERTVAENKKHAKRRVSFQVLFAEQRNLPTPSSALQTILDSFVELAYLYHNKD